MALIAIAAPTSTPSVTWNQHASRMTMRVNDLGQEYAVTTETYYSQAIPLKAGHMIFTDAKKTPITMPTGEYAILDFIGDIVDDSHQPVPLSDVYDHHWVAKSTTHKNALCSGGLGYVFGIGAESRNNGVTFPAHMGYVVPDGTLWGANIHLLRTQGLKGDNPYKAAKECNECYYGPNKGSQCTPSKNGTFACCGEHDTEGVAYCEVAEGELPPEKVYHLRYTLSYTESVLFIIPLEIGTFSAPHCASYYDVYRNDANPVDVKSYELKIPADVSVVFATGHIHTGGINISLSVNGQHACTSVPTYGTEEGAPGNEKGYLVKMSGCVDVATGALPLKKNDIVRIDGRYWVGSTDDRIGYADGTHLNVMAYMYTAYYKTGTGFYRGRPVDVTAPIK